MPGHLEGILYAHKAIMKEVRDLEEAAKELNWEDGAQVTALLDRFKLFRIVVTEHEHGEEEVFFPLMEGRFRYIAATYVYDHEHHTDLYGEIQDLLTDLGRDRSARERSRTSRRLHRQTIALNVVMDSHIGKENELLLPVFDEHFPLEEIEAMVGQFMQSMPPELMRQMGPWVFVRQTDDDREGLLRMAMQEFPPELMKGMAQGLSQVVSSQEWQDMLRRVPELKAFSG